MIIQDSFRLYDYVKKYFYSCFLLLMIKLLLLPVLLIAASVMSAQSSTPIGLFQHSEDIGNPKVKGSSHYDAKTQVYTLKGAGYNIWFERDELHYL